MLKQHPHARIITCLLGDPVEHSVSDSMFQYFAKLTGLKNYIHIKFRIARDIGHHNLQLAMRALCAFNIAGANITLPYKEAAIRYLDASDRTVRSVGAVNTVVREKKKLIGYNTDGYGAIRAIETMLRPMRRSDRVVVLGVGGAARAILGSIPKVAGITVLSRQSDAVRAKKLKRDFSRFNIKIETKLINKKNIVLALKEADFVINATPVGMYPKSGDSLLHIHHLRSAGVCAARKINFFDAVFNPFETKFLKLAKKYGAKTCPGIYMMIHQGIRAFELWTGKNVPRANIEKTRKLLQKVIKTTYAK